VTGGRRAAVGATWMYGAQVATITLQFGYAAVTSRTISPAGFGAYAVALSVTALVGLLSSGGLAQTSARLTLIERSVVRGLLSYGILLGLAGSAFLFLTASFWASLWGSPDSAILIRWLSVSTLIAPSLGLASGIVRRLGKFRELAIVTIAANILGMGIGVLTVLKWPGAASLLVSPILAQFFIFCGAFILNGRMLLGLGRLKSAAAEARFSFQIILTTMASYLTGNVGKWSASFGLGSAALGQWNRADVVAFVPFQQIQAALIQSVYPEFRHDRADGVRAREVWPDLLGIVAWAVFPITAGAAVILPHIIPVLFGQGWEVAASLAVPIAIAGGLQIIASLLSSGIEAIGRFRWIWAGQVLMMVASAAGAVGALTLHTLTPLMLSIVAVVVIQHCVQLFFAVRHGYVDFKKLMGHYFAAAATAVTFAIFLWLAAQAILVTEGNLWVVLGCLMAAILTLSLLWIFRLRLAPVKLAIKYGLLKRF
jgi:O-antigen/teichoic acid export membrane protein